MVIQAIQISQTRRDSSIWKELQSAALTLLTDNATWVPSLSAIECAEALARDAFPNGNQLGFAITATWLENSVQMELAALWTPAAASHSERQNAMLDIRAGRLFVPCIRLQAVQQEVVEDVDALLLDAVRRDHPTPARWDLDRQGRPYPAGDGKGHYLALKDHMLARERCHTVPELKEPTSSMSIAPPPPAMAASNDNFSEQFDVPPPAHNESEVFESTIPPNTFTSASLAFQQYAELAPVPADLEQGIPLALMSCGYMPRRVAKCLKETFVPSLISPSSARKSYIAARNTVLWLDTEASAYHRSRALLLQAPIIVDSEWDAPKLNRGSWSDGDHKHLLEHYRHPPYDGTSWHGMYERVALPPPLCFLRRDALESIPLSTRVALSQSVPDHLREALKKQMDDGKAIAHALQRQFFGVPGVSDGVDQDENDAGSVYPITISFDEPVWSDITQREIVKVPTALVKFKSLDLDSLLKLRHLRQGPGYGRTLFVLNPNGTPYLPKAQHVIVLKRYSCADDLVDMWASNLAGMQKSLSQLSLRRDSKKATLLEYQAIPSKKLKLDGADAWDPFLANPHPTTATTTGHTATFAHRLAIEPGSSIEPYPHSPPVD
ncbi:hypothetical protein FRC04_009230 [Tulasnella sp. 424]|nr:hypothetical protein FRC04_009230 [Tulasnella sp. 424]KAG8973581.1 hypothetical protein FRC05_008650 [Tulasnella sp. 425]